MAFIETTVFGDFFGTDVITDGMRGKLLLLLWWF